MGWTRWQSKVAAGTVADLHEADLPGVLAGGADPRRAAVRAHPDPGRGGPGPRCPNLGGGGPHRASRHRHGRGRRSGTGWPRGWPNCRRSPHAPS